ncbi:phosphatidyl-ethanolamine-binding protein [Aphelenchoides avenae]|nr:phosphatidyl-ethanolamine-binding protein [Aphelenchus avenae]KAH7728383.1 phosphatidyl-ethanolamine-binding protein [Aphelenchus avenae]
MSEVASKFSAAEIVPSILPEPPKEQLNVVFEGIQVQPGQEIPVRNLKNAPRVTLKVDPDSTFSIVMIDPDNLSRKNPSVAEWLHWLVVNIPASNILEGINGGQHQQPYGSPAPQPRTGDHRYVIVLFEHQGRRLAVPKYNSRAKFSLKQFIEKHKLGAPLAANFWISKNEVQ